MVNIISVYNEQTKEIFQVRVNPVLSIGGLKERIASHYGIEVSSIAIIFNGVRYQTKITRASGKQYGDDRSNYRDRFAHQNGGPG
jgi:uncharacterized protein YhbP (UPF0306 family)